MYLRLIPYSFYGLFTVVVILPSSQLCGGDHALFPWGKLQQAVSIDPATLPLYHSLTKAPLQDQHHAPPPPVAVQPLPEKRAYAYGWFGSNPSPTWGRHFGNSKGYTQWTPR
ncbi:MAG TPA: hypothetical protein DCF63_02375 [Planctomycetaceae bacterium]|nr:hypothetical protein [Planctomycetaceae bacterium]